MRIAKLEMKVVLVLLLVGYDYELVDASGQYPKSLPQPDRNDIQQVFYFYFVLREYSHFHDKARPLGEPCYLKFKRVIE